MCSGFRPHFFFRNAPSGAYPSGRLSRSSNPDSLAALLNPSNTPPPPPLGPRCASVLASHRCLASGYGYGVNADVVIRLSTSSLINIERELE